MSKHYVAADSASVEQESLTGVTVLEDIVRRGDGVGFDDLKQKAFPSQPNGYSTFAAQSSTSGYQPYTMAPQRNGAGLSGSNRIPTGGKRMIERVDSFLATCT